MDEVDEAGAQVAEEPALTLAPNSPSPSPSPSPQPSALSPHPSPHLSPHPGPRWRRSRAASCASPSTWSTRARGSGSSGWRCSGGAPSPRPSSERSSAPASLARVSARAPPRPPCARRAPPPAWPHASPPGPVGRTSPAEPAEEATRNQLAAVSFQGLGGLGETPPELRARARRRSRSMGDIREQGPSHGTSPLGAGGGGEAAAEPSEPSAAVTAGSATPVSPAARTRGRKAPSPGW